MHEVEELPNLMACHDNFIAYYCASDIIIFSTFSCHPPLKKLQMSVFMFKFTSSATPLEHANSNVFDALNSIILPELLIWNAADTSPSTTGNRRVLSPRAAGIEQGCKASHYNF